MKRYSAYVQAPVAVIRQTKKAAFLYAIKITLLMVSFMISGKNFTRAQCVSPYMVFHSPVLIAGTDNQIGAVYLFPEVIPGVDAQIKVVDLVGGAAIWNIDDSTGIGYYDAFQPYVVAPANTTSYVDWEITFKIAGTSTDTSLACFAITGIDVDGNGVDLQEFIEAATPGSYALDPNTILNFSFDGVRSKAISRIDNIPLIDTAHREAMFQMNFSNISTLKYRNGAISTYGGDMVRQTCIYFKSFFDTYSLLLPVKMTSFSAQPKNGSVLLNWSATNENDLTNYTVQKSTNGSSWKDIQTVKPGFAATNTYFVTDNEKNTGVGFYRIKQTIRTGQIVYSAIIKVSPGGFTGSITSNTLIKNAIDIQINAAAIDRYQVEVYAMNGSRVKQQQLAISAGFNTVTVEMPPAISNGLYVLTVKNSRGELIHHARLVRN
ncbi:MAG: T9SS type A sorting domain-containing protein [Bacteroidota bacterium]